MAGSEVILFFGAIPPPIGGVSVYCMRRLDELRKEQREFFFFDSRSNFNFLHLIMKGWLLFLLRRGFSIEINVSNPVVIFVILLSGLARFSVFFDHNGSRRFVGSVQNLVLALFARRCRKIWLVNIDLAERYRNIGAYDSSKFEIRSPYLPPSQGEIDEANSRFGHIYNKIKQCGRRNVVLASAWKAIDSAAEPDLYGLLDTLDVYSNLVDEFPELTFVVIVSELGNAPMDDLLRDRISRLSGCKNFIFVTGGVPQWPLLESTLILLRLTKTDGDSVSVREALSSDCYVIATDVCTRPAGVITVPVGDIGVVIERIRLLMSGRSV